MTHPALSFMSYTYAIIIVCNHAMYTYIIGLLLKVDVKHITKTYKFVCNSLFAFQKCTIYKKCYTIKALYNKR